jgi:hypothetical protein
VINTWEAIRLDNIVRTGRTKPLIIECVSREDRRLRRSMLVKAFALPEVDHSGLFCELMGNLLARDFGIDTPEPGLVYLSNDFITVTNLVLRTHGLRLVSGVGVGCEYFQKGFTTPFLGAAFIREEMAQAALIYAYDLIVQNPDRHAKNPNCSLLGNRWVAFDFNLAFSFIHPLIGVQPKPWELSKIKFENQHIFHRPLQRQCIDWTPLLAAVKAMDRRRIESWSNDLPLEWRTWTPTICEHLDEVQAHADNLEMELQRSLA